MKLVQDTNDADFLINSYENGVITINKKPYKKSLIVGATELVTDWPPQSLVELKPEHWDTIIEKQPDVLIIGTGAEMDFISPEILAPLHEHRIGVEVMSTRSACRTLNVLIAENRYALAALLL